jgi:hypothetical protein
MHWHSPGTFADFSKLIPWNFSFKTDTAKHVFFWSLIPILFLFILLFWWSSNLLEFMDWNFDITSSTPLLGLTSIVVDFEPSFTSLTLNLSLPILNTFPGTNISPLGTSTLICLVSGAVFSMTRQMNRSWKSTFCLIYASSYPSSLLNCAGSLLTNGLLFLNCILIRLKVSSLLTTFFDTMICLLCLITTPTTLLGLLISQVKDVVAQISID